MKQFVWESLMAGVMIGIGCIAFCSVPNPIVGAMLFSLGLITVLKRNYNLYTGKVGFARELSDIPILIVMFFLNALGIGLVALCASTFLNTDVVANISAKKEFSDLWGFFFKSIGCGMCMAIAVKCKETWVGVILPVMLFVLVGFEHSVANVFYFTIGSIGFIKALGLTCLVVVGNAIGAKMITKEFHPQL